MQPQLNDQPGHTLLRNPVNLTGSETGILLALDGHRLERPALPLALDYCKRAGKRLDILLLNPPKPSTLMLGKFLRNLEMAGIDYRLSSGEGELADQLPHYLRRYKSIKFVLLDKLDKLDVKLEMALAALRQNEYQIHALVDHGSERLISKG
jgi:hypothetical protein